MDGPFALARILFYEDFQVLLTSAVKFITDFLERNALRLVDAGGYDIHEMLGTKLRVLFQRKRGRDFVEILEAHLLDRGFCADMGPLLRTGITYAPQAAGKHAKAHLLNLLPE